MTRTVRLVLEALLRAWDDDPTAVLYGLEITARTGLLLGTTYPILQRLLEHGWLTDEWEDLDPREATPPRPRARLQVVIERDRGPTPLVAQWGGISLARKTMIGNLDPTWLTNRGPAGLRVVDRRFAAAVDEMGALSG